MAIPYFTQFFHILQLFQHCKINLLFMANTTSTLPQVSFPQIPLQLYVQSHSVHEKDLSFEIVLAKLEIFTQNSAQANLRFLKPSCLVSSVYLHSDFDIYMHRNALKTYFRSTMPNFNNGTTKPPTRYYNRIKYLLLFSPISGESIKTHFDLKWLNSLYEATHLFQFGIDSTFQVIKSSTHLCIICTYIRESDSFSGREVPLKLIPLANLGATTLQDFEHPSYSHNYKWIVGLTCYDKLRGNIVTNSRFQSLRGITQLAKLYREKGESDLYRIVLSGLISSHLNLTDIDADPRGEDNYRPHFCTNRLSDVSHGFCNQLKNHACHFFPFDYKSYSFMTCSPIGKHWLQFSSLFKPFTFGVWLALLSAISACSFCIWTVRLLKDNDHKVYKSLEIFFRIILENSPSFEESLGDSLKFILVPWLFTGIVLSNGYKGIVTNYTTAPTEQDLPQTFHQLKSATFSIITAGLVRLGTTPMDPVVISDTAMKPLIEGFTSSLHAWLLDNILGAPGSTTFCHNIIYQGGVVYFGPYLCLQCLSIEMAKKLGLKRRGDRPWLLDMCGEVIKQEVYASFLSQLFLKEFNRNKNHVFQYLLENSNRVETTTAVNILADCQSSAFVAGLKEISEFILFMSDKPKKSADISRFVSQSVASNILSVFVLLLGGLAISMGVFVREILPDYETLKSRGRLAVRWGCTKLEIVGSSCSFL
ncbi:hypothetical protein Fcan01_26140 [Folsomia candida]|uniref:Uncharacterized protein n=1 Tax=Folsomia candida TaxID=158441 RepID=A0A226D2I4_FOLCA|nr:hypothetical protein Fcan01_26140 [Folsomia candida]